MSCVLCFFCPECNEDFEGSLFDNGGGFIEAELSKEMFEVELLGIELGNLEDILHTCLGIEILSVGDMLGLLYLGESGEGLESVVARRSSCLN